MKESGKTIRCMAEASYTKMARPKKEFGETALLRMKKLMTF